MRRGESCVGNPGWKGVQAGGHARPMGIGSGRRWCEGTSRGHALAMGISVVEGDVRQPGADRGAPPVDGGGGGDDGYD